MPMIKPMCTFRRMNLNNTPWPFQNQFHVVFCRNVLYYFDRPLQQELVERIYDHTLPGGWLITSVTETLYWAKTRWQTITTGVYRKI
jgi:chemotaxis protein methyltransferase CheR